MSLVASRKRAPTVIENLRPRNVPETDRQLKAPAGLDIGAVAPEKSR